jgi:hypothetical protein
MCSDFRTEFEAARDEFNKMRDVHVIASAINDQTISDLTSDYATMLELLTLLARLHYMAHARRCFTFADLLFPVQGIRQVSVAASLGLFVRTNHKDRYAVLIAFLNNRPDLFAQILYLSFVVPSNPGIVWPGHAIFGEDDVVFFCFCTFPAIYNYFLTHADQTAGVALIERMFAFHFLTHGANFAKRHKFLSFCVSSFFLTTNPGLFFDSIGPILQRFRSSTVYESTVHNSVLRNEYWTSCLECAIAILEKLEEAVPLLPPPARFLATRL